MRIKHILEAAMPFNAPVKTSGLTFGFEAELVAPKTLYSDPADLYDIDDICGELGANEEKFNEEFEQWKEDNEQPDAEPIDWINDIGEKTWWELVDADGQWQFLLDEDGSIARVQTWDLTMDYIGEDLREFSGQRVAVANDAETAFNDKGNYSSWFIEADPSVHGKDEMDHGLEIVSPIFKDYDTFCKTLRSFLEWVSERGLITNTSTGLHVNIGDPNRTIDPLKLLLFTGESWVKSQWKRDENIHAQAILPQIGQLPASVDNARQIVQTYIGDINEKHFAVNLKTLLERGYVEFRPIGNQDYHMQADKILTHVNRFVQIMTIAATPDKYRKEYARKLGLLISGGSSTPTMALGVDVRLVMKWMDTIRFSERDRAKIIQNGKIIISGETLLAILGYTETSDERMPDVVLRTLAKHADLADIYPTFRAKILARTPYNMDDETVTALVARVDALLNYRPPAA
jgi:hypothetical protein